MEGIPYGRQYITDEDIQSVVEVLKSDYLTQGPKIQEFEEAFAKYVGSKYAVAVTNGTAALHLCALSLEVKPGQKVITTPITFAASANCIRYCGGEIVFADIDPTTYLLDINEVRKQLEADDTKSIKGIIPVDFTGRSVNMEAYRSLANEFNCWIIEDACHAPGASFVNSSDKEVKAGSGLYADLAIFSFHPVKHIATGEGGMVTTNTKELYEKIKTLRTHGITKDKKQFLNPINMTGDYLEESFSNASYEYPYWYMEMQCLGYNYRISDINCALGLSQLKRAEKGLIERMKIAVRYFEAFKSIPQITDYNNMFFSAQSQEGSEAISLSKHAYHLYVIEVPNRMQLYNHLRSKNIFTQVHYVPCHLMPYYQSEGWGVGDMPNAESYYSRCISLPMFPTLKIEEQEYVIDEIVEFFRKKSR
ncbi:MAG: UDP-4-amino-4,6-dideoxy-N-acetyl-beta-L-altrosamine transaminase [Cyclobacteriaceae bacterium]